MTAYNEKITEDEMQEFMEESKPLEPGDQVQIQPKHQKAVRALADVVDDMGAAFTEAARQLRAHKAKLSKCLCALYPEIDGYAWHLNTDDMVVTILSERDL